MLSICFILGFVLLATGQETKEELAQLCERNNKNDGLVLVAIQDCTRFVSCDGIVYHGVQDCGEGTLFDVNTKQCEAKVNVTCNLPKSRSLGCVSGANPDDCSKFYRCSNGIQHYIQCGEDTVFDPTIGSCNYPRAVSDKRKGECRIKV